MSYVISDLFNLTLFTKRESTSIELNFYGEGVGYPNHVEVPYLHEKFSDFLASFECYLKIEELFVYYNASQDDFVVKILLNTVDLTKFVGVSRDCNFNSAHNRAILKLFTEMLDKPSFYMPRLLYSLPNTKGYCFLNSVLMLFLYSPVFIKSMLRAIYFDTNKLYEQPELYLEDKDVESFTPIARTRLDEIRLCYIIKWIYTILLKSSLMRAPHLDVSIKLEPLMNQVVNHLAQKVNRDWFYPGGFIKDALMHIIQEISVFSVKLKEQVCITMAGDFNCNKCGTLINDRQFYISFLKIPPKCMIHHKIVNLTTIISNEKFWIDSVEEVCGVVTGNSVCNGKPLTWTKFTCLNFPNFFVTFYVLGYDFTRLNFIDGISPLPVLLNDKYNIKEYEVRGFSATFPIFKTPQAVIRGIRSINQGEPGDTLDSFHSVSCVKAIDANGYIDFAECNNGNIYIKSPTITTVQPGSVWFYQQVEKFGNWIPSIHEIII